MRSVHPGVRSVKAQRYVSQHPVDAELAAVGFHGPTLAVLGATPDPIVATEPRPAAEPFR